MTVPLWVTHLPDCAPLLSFNAQKDSAPPASSLSRAINNSSGLIYLRNFLGHQYVRLGDRLIASTFQHVHIRWVGNVSPPPPPLTTFAPSFSRAMAGWLWMFTFSQPARNSRNRPPKSYSGYGYCSWRIGGVQHGKWNEKGTSTSVPVCVDPPR